MKFIITSLLLLFFCVSIHAQKSEASSYLIVRLVESKDYAIDSTYWKILADAGNPHATEIYQLHPFPNQKVPPGYHVHFYKTEKDAPPLFNYFQTPTAALNFLSVKGWHLMAVIAETNTRIEREWAEGKTVLIPMVSTIPVYYFRRQTFEN